MRAFMDGFAYWLNRTCGFSFLGLWPMLVKSAEGEGGRGRSLAARLAVVLVVMLSFGFGVGAFWLARLRDADWALKVVFYVLGAYFFASGLALAVRSVWARTRQRC